MIILKPWMKASVAIAVILGVAGSVMAVASWTSSIDARISKIEEQVSSLSYRMARDQVQAMPSGHPSLPSEALDAMLKNHRDREREADLKVKEAEEGVRNSIRNQEDEAERRSIRQKLEMLQLDVDQMKGN